MWKKNKSTTSVFLSPPVDGGQNKRMDSSALINGVGKKFELFSESIVGV